MKAVWKKTRKNAGFSLGETLIAILILLMVSAIVAGAIPTASHVYAKTVDAANAQVLLSTTMTVLRDELGTATDVEKTDSTTLTYNKGSRSIAYTEDPAGIWLRYKRKDAEGNDVTESLLLVSQKAATKDMVVSYTGVTVDEETITFSGLQVTKAGYEKALAGQNTYTIRRAS